MFFAGGPAVDKEVRGPYNSSVPETGGEDDFMRIMAIDYGDARTGVAFSDLTGSIVGRTAVVHERDTARLLAALTNQQHAKQRAAQYQQRAAEKEQSSRISVELFKHMLSPFSSAYSTGRYNGWTADCQ